MEYFHKRLKKLLVAIFGGIVILAGLIMVPYPGPGWLTVFAGLAILATEFVFAQKLLKYGREKYNDWAIWLTRQHWAIRLFMLIFTVAVVLATLWLLNVFGWAVTLLNLPFEWLISPLFR